MLDLEGHSYLEPFHVKGSASGAMDKLLLLLNCALMLANNNTICSSLCTDSRFIASRKRTHS